MKLKFLILGILGGLVLAGCKNNQVETVAASQIETLKKNVKQKAEGESWTNTLNENKDFEVEDKLSSYVSKSVENYRILSPIANPVYPELADFTSIDLSIYNKINISFLKKFCSQFAKDCKSDLSEFFDEEYRFTYVLFRNDLNNLLINEYNLEKAPVFETWVIGKGDLSTNSNFIQVPILFKSENYNLYLKLLLNPDTNLFYEMQVSKWEVLDAK